MPVNSQRFTGNGVGDGPPSPATRLLEWIERFVERHEFVESVPGSDASVTWHFADVDRRLIVDLIDEMLGDEEFWNLARLAVEHYAESRAAASLPDPSGITKGWVTPKEAHAEIETPCPKRSDREHCNCWYDGRPCCACGAGGLDETCLSPAAREQ